MAHVCRITRRLLVIVCLTTLVGCSEVTPPPVEEDVIMPLDTGNSWDYEITIVNKQVTLSLTKTAVGSAEVEGTEVTKVEWSGDFAPYSGYFTYLRNESGGLYYHGDSFEEYSTPDLLCKSTGVVDDSWSRSGVTWEVIAVSESIIVPAGAFECIHMRETVDEGGGLVSDIWYKVGIGMIKMESEGQVMTLVDTNLDSGTDKGAIIIDPSPDDINAPWTCSNSTSDDTESGNGDAVLTDMTPGEYTIIWGSVAGWFAPSGSTQALVAGSEVTFAGTYTEETSSPEAVFLQIPPAATAMPVTFTMGSTDDQWGSNAVHQVTLTRRFWMSDTEVTNGQYVEALQWALDQGYVTATADSVRDNLDGSDRVLIDLSAEDCLIAYSGGTFSTNEPARPVVEVSWYGAVAYCDWLSMQEGLTKAYDHSTWKCNDLDPYGAQGYRLPTEAEWELACRAGTTSEFNTGQCLSSATEANYDGRPYSGCPFESHTGHVVDVKSFPANGWGLFDMHGNAAEWTNDFYETEDYGNDAIDPTGPWSVHPPGYQTMVGSAVRSGDWDSRASDCRSASRSGSPFWNALNHSGFRPVRTASGS